MKHVLVHFILHHILNYVKPYMLKLMLQSLTYSCHIYEKHVLSIRRVYIGSWIAHIEHHIIQVIQFTSYCTCSHQRHTSHIPTRVKCSFIGHQSVPLPQLLATYHILVFQHSTCIPHPLPTFFSHTHPFLHFWQHLFGGSRIRTHYLLRDRPTLTSCALPTIEIRL